MRCLRYTLQVQVHVYCSPFFTNKRQKKQQQQPHYFTFIFKPKTNYPHHFQIIYFPFRHLAYSFVLLLPFECEMPSVLDQQRKKKHKKIYGNWSANDGKKMTIIKYMDVLRSGAQIHHTHRCSYTNNMHSRLPSV